MVIRLKRKIDSARVQAAIERAEQRSSGEVVVSIADFFFGNVQRAARRTFERMGIANTQRRNGVLLFVVPARRQFEIVADVGIHQRVHADFWRTIAATLSQRFRDRDYTGGLVEAIDTIGAELVTHFPREPGDVNELADQPHRYRWGRPAPTS